MTRTLQIGYWNEDEWTKESIALSLDLSPSTTLRIICQSIHNAADFGQFLVAEWEANPETTEVWLRGFLQQIRADLNLLDPISQ